MIKKQNNDTKQNQFSNQSRHLMSRNSESVGTVAPNHTMINPVAKKIVIVIIGSITTKVIIEDTNVIIITMVIPEGLIIIKLKILTTSGSWKARHNLKMTLRSL